jgi:hypothetical protein
MNADSLTLLGSFVYALALCAAVGYLRLLRAQPR